MDASIGNSKPQRPLSEPRSKPLSKSEQELALATIKSGQQMAGHNPSPEDLERAARVLAGTTSAEDAVAEIGTQFFTHEELIDRLTNHQANHSLRDDLDGLAADTTDDRGPGPMTVHCDREDRARRMRQIQAEFKERTSKRTPEQQSLGPQCATVSPSKNPGSASTSSPALRILIEDRSKGEGFVVETPLIWSVALATIPIAMPISQQAFSLKMS